MTGDVGIWRSIAAAPESERVKAWNELRTVIVESPEYIEENSGEVCDLLFESTEKHLSRKCQQLRERALRAGLASEAFRKDFVVKLVHACSSPHGFFRYRLLLMWTTEALIAIGEDDSMGKAVKKVIECQGKLIEYIVKVRHVNAYKLQSSVGAVLRRNPKLLDIYLDVCKSSASGSLINVLSITLTEIKQGNMELALGVFLEIFIEKVLSAKVAPERLELECYRKMLESLTMDDVKTKLMPSAVKMSKRSPEAAIEITAFALGCLSIDLSGFSDDLSALMLQQGKHAKETVRSLTQELAAVVARKTYDTGIISAYVKSISSVVEGKAGGKLKNAQERSSMALLLGTWAPVCTGKPELEPTVSDTVKVIEDTYNGEGIDEVKAALLKVYTKWLEVLQKVPEGFPEICTKALKDKEPVRRAFLKSAAVLSESESMAKKMQSVVDDFSKVVLDGCQKAAMRWDGAVALLSLLNIAHANQEVHDQLEKNGVWNAIGKDRCPLFSTENLNRMSFEDAKPIIALMRKVLTWVGDQHGRSPMTAGAEFLTLSALHIDTKIRLECIDSVKEVASLGSTAALDALLNSIRHWATVTIDSITSIITTERVDGPIFSNLALSERFLDVLLAVASNATTNTTVTQTAKIIVLAHIRVIACHRRSTGAWRSLKKCILGLVDTIYGNPEAIVNFFFDNGEWGINSSSLDVREAAIEAVGALAEVAFAETFEPFMSRVRLQLDKKQHDNLTAKQLLIYATPHDMLSNEARDGGLIPAEIMEEMLADKAAIKPPVFPPSLEFALECEEKAKASVESKAKGRSKEDAAAVARRQQFADEASIRAEVAKIRETLSIALTSLASYSRRNPRKTEENLLIIAAPCLDFLSSPIVGNFAALMCLDEIVASVSGTIGRHHVAFSSSLYRIAVEEGKKDPNYTHLAEDMLIQKSASALVSATGGSPPMQDVPARKGFQHLSGNLYAFFFPIVKAILRSNKPSALHQSLLDFIDLHSQTNMALPPEEEFSLLFHVLEIVPSLRESGKTLLVRICGSRFGKESICLYFALQGVLLGNALSRRAVLSSIDISVKSTEDLGELPGHYLQVTKALLWIACNDIDDENGAFGSSIWKHLNFKLDEKIIEYILPFCGHKFSEIRKSAARALGQCVESLQASDPEISTAALVGVIEKLYSQSGDFNSRIGSCDCLRALSCSLSSDGIMKALDFLLGKGFLDTDSEVRSSMIASGVSIIDAAGSRAAETLLPLFERYLEKNAVEGLSEADYDHVRLGAVVCIGATAQHLDPNNPKVVSIVQTLLDVLKTPSETVQRSVSDRLPPLMKSLVAVNKEFVEQIVSGLVSECLHGATYGDRRGAAYGISGSVKGLGLSSLKNYGIMEALKSGVENKKDPIEREGSLIAFECLSNKLGRLFEPYVIQILPMLLASLGDGKVEVREAAEAASHVIMSQLTAQGVKLVLPSLMRGAEEKQWRAKQGSIQLLGSMAYCAPKQLSTCLPTIVPVLSEALADPHPKVSSSARDALDEVGSVIRNPEVAKLVPSLMAALADPNKNNKAALSKLLSTIFVNTIDSPSLALIIPVVHRGLRDRSGDIKKRAARIVGNLCALINDPKDMSPYLPTLMPELRNSLIDPLPEVRAAAAKALGALTAGMATVDTDESDILPWLLETMRSENSSVERSGAAQGLAEVLAVKGSHVLDEVLPAVFQGCSSRSSAVREGSVTLFKYLPYCMPDEFQRFLPDMLPCVLGGLADEAEGVREASFSAGSVAVELYAKTALSEVLPAVESGAEDPNWRIRQSSIELLGDLLFKVAGTSGRIQQDLHDEESEGISAEEHGQAIIDTLGIERRNEVLARLYLARSDVAYTVRSAALHVWKTVVTNTPKTLVEILGTLMDKVITGLSQEEDRRASAGQCLGELVRKLGDRVLPQIVPILIKGAYSEDCSTRIGVCNGMNEVTSNASRTQLAEHMADLIGEVQRLLCDEDQDVRTAAGGVLDTMFKTGGGSAAESVIPSLLSGLSGGEEKSAKSLEGLRVVLGVRPQLLAAMVPRLVDPPLTRTDVVALGALGEVAGSAIHPFLSKVMPPLFVLVNDEEMGEVSLKTLEAISKAVEEDGVQLFISQIHRGIEKKESTYGACKTLAWFARNTSLDFQEYVGNLFGSVAPLLASPSPKQDLEAAWDALFAVSSTIPKDMAPSFVRPLKDAMLAAKEKSVREGQKPDAVLLPGLDLPKSLQPFVPIYLQGILQGSSAELREVAAEAMGELVELTHEASLKPFVIQITGPLIRIVGDRFPSQTKVAILHTMGVLVTKAGMALRPFVPQLQTTFVKCLPDAARAVRLEGAYNLGKLATLAPRLDQLVGDIATNSLKADVDGPKEAYLTALACILETSGAKLSDDTLGKVSQAVQDGAEQAIRAEHEICIRSAAKALGQYCEVCSTNELHNVLEANTFGPLGTNMTASSSSRLCASVFASSVGSLGATRLKEAGLLDGLLSSIVTLSKDVSVDTRMASSIACGRVVISELTVSGISPSLEKVVKVLIAHLGPDQHVEVQKQALGILKSISKACGSALEPFFPAIIPSLISITKESTGTTKLAAERTLAKVLQLEAGEDMVSTYLAQPNIGILPKQVLTEAYLRRLTRISDIEVDDLADYAL